jgi:ubiquinone/menaquinone biosynthesis C-methylase UbiE
MSKQQTEYDVFVSYHSADLNQVIQIVRKLRDLRLHLWFAPWSLIPGEQFQQEIEDAISYSKTMAVFIGSSGLGPWAEKEVRTMLMDKIKSHENRIIPVFLPGAPDIEKLPSFLRLHHSVDFRESISSEDAFLSLIAGIWGIPPSEISIDKISFEPSSRPISRPFLGLLKRNTIKSYDEIAKKYYEEWFHRPPTDILELFLEHIPKKSDVLDVGCGPGHHALYLSKRNHNVIGIDLSKAILDIATKKVNSVKFQSMDIQHLEFPRNTFDGIWSAGSTIHIPREELIDLLFGYKRVMKKTGILGLNLQVYRKSEIAEDGRFFEFYDGKTEITNLLSYIGFDVMSEKYEEVKMTTHDKKDLITKWITLYCKYR